MEPFEQKPYIKIEQTSDPCLFTHLQVKSQLLDVSDIKMEPFEQIKIEQTSDPCLFTDTLEDPSFVMSPPFDEPYGKGHQSSQDPDIITVEKLLAPDWDMSLESMKTLKPFRIGQLATYLNSAVEPSYKKYLFTVSRCKHMLKALTIYVANTPVDVSENLFKEDQKTGSNSTDIQQRDWRFVFGHFSRLYALWQERKNRPFKYVVDTLPEAVFMGQIMNDFHRSQSSNEYVGVIFGFWVAKLYMVSNSQIKLNDFPEPLKKAYEKFINWKGERFHFQPPSLPLADPIFTKFGVTSETFPFAVVDGSVTKFGVTSETFPVAVVDGSEKQTSTLVSDEKPESSTMANEPPRANKRKRKQKVEKEYEYY